MAKATEITLKKIDIVHTQLYVTGDSELVMHQWSEKAKRQMRDKQQKKASAAKEVRDPEAEYEATIYRMPDGAPSPYGFPAVGFKSTIVGAARWSDGVKMTELRGALHIEGDLVPIFGEPVMREDMVRVGMGAADLRYRASFFQWMARLDVAFNSAAISLEQIVYLLNVGGFGIGVGEFRPEKDGSWGRFHVATEDEINSFFG